MTTQVLMSTGGIRTWCKDGRGRAAASPAVAVRVGVPDLEWGQRKHQQCLNTWWDGCWAARRLGVNNAMRVKIHCKGLNLETTESDGNRDFPQIKTQVKNTTVDFQIVFHGAFS